MGSDKISVISVQEMDGDEELEENSQEEVEKNDRKFTLQNMFEALGTSGFGIIGFSLLFIVPWTSIPRTDSIIYQSHWMEVLLPTASFQLLTSGRQVLNLTTWTQETTIMSIWNYLKVYFLSLIPSTLLYISANVLWSVYLQHNHPLPFLSIIVYLPTSIINVTGLWFILPANLLTRKDFRQKLKIFTFYCFWLLIPMIVKEILSSLFINPPGGFQFLIPFLIVGWRELDKRVILKVVKKMMGELNEGAAALIAISIGSDYSFFIAIRLVGAELATVCCTVAIDFALHLRMTIKIIKEYKRVNNEKLANTRNNTKIASLIIAELVEGFTPAIYAIGIIMAYYGPNARLFSNIRNNYWSTEIEDLGPLFVTMSTLFGVDIISVMINSFCIWKLVKVNMLSEIFRVLKNYWYIIALSLSANMSGYFATIDINMGNDATGSFQWTSNEGWIKLVNTSIVLTNEEKLDLIAKATFQ